jgi:hypothetical protein
MELLPEDQEAARRFADLLGLRTRSERRGDLELADWYADRIIADVLGCEQSA